jgi:hypothetical protein
MISSELRGHLRSQPAARDSAHVATVKRDLSPAVQDYYMAHRTLASFTFACSLLIYERQSWRVGEGDTIRPIVLRHGMPGKLFGASRKEREDFE